MPYLRDRSLDSNQELSSVLQRNFLLRWAFYPVERTLVKRVAVDIFTDHF